MDSHGLSGKHVLITGAAKRVGKHLAERFGELGCRVTRHSFQTPLPPAPQNSPHTQAVSFDLRDRTAISAGIATAVAAFGPVDILVNSASVFTRTPLGTVTPEQWDTILHTNLSGQFFVAQAVAGSMKAGGVILNIADTAAVRSMQPYAPYLAAKGGLLSLTRALAKELAPAVRVNAISPGWVLPAVDSSEEQIARNVARTLLGRLGSPEDIFQAAKFLAENSYITGFNLIVDGGRETAYSGWRSIH